MNNRNFIIIILVLIVTAIIGLNSFLPSRFENRSGIMVSNFPKTIGDWTAKDIPVPERDYEILETRNLIMREYTNPKGESVTLYIIYSEDNRKAIHPPEICLTGGGQSIEEKGSVQIGNIRAVKLSMERGSFRQMVLYWFKTKNLNTDRYVNQQLKVAFDLLRGKKVSSAMVRVTTEIKNNNTQASLDLLKQFVLKVEKLLPKYVP